MTGTASIQIDARRSARLLGPLLVALGLFFAGETTGHAADAPVIPAQVRAIHQVAKLGANVESFCATLIETARITLQTAGHPLRNQLNAEQQERWLAALEGNCRSDEMSERHLAAFAADYDAESARSVSEWYTSEAGKRLLEFETAAAETDWEAEVVPFVEQIMREPVPVERVKLFERIDAAVGSTDDAAILQIGIGEVLTAGAQALLPDEKRTPRAELDAQFAALRAQAAGQMHAQQSVIFMYVYREASNAELAAYAEFAESPAGRWLHSTHRLAMVQLLAEIREAVAAELSAG